MSDKPYEGIDSSTYDWWRNPPVVNPDYRDLSEKLNELYEKSQKEAEQSLWETLFGK